MHQETCRLVDDHEVVVFIDDANGYVLWREGVLFRKGDADLVAFMDEVRVEAAWPLMVQMPLCLIRRRNVDETPKCFKAPPNDVGRMIVPTVK